MSDNKSLGSSPIGFKSGDDRLGFIPDLGVETKKSDHSVSLSKSEKKSVDSAVNPTDNTTKENSEKKIASYSLDKNLVAKLKRIAEEHNIYYSKFVSDAIQHWIKKHEY